MTDDTTFPPDGPSEPLEAPQKPEKVPGAKKAALVKSAKEKGLGNILTFTPPKTLTDGLVKRKTYWKAYNERVADEICARLLAGTPLAQICAADGMPDYTTVRRWEESHPEFAEKSAKAKREGSHYIADDCMRIADDESIDPSHKRIMVDTRLRLIKAWHRKAYGDNLAVGGDESSPVRFFIDGLSDKEPSKS